MDSCTIQLTPAAHKYGNLNIKPCGKEFFPPDIFGAPSKKASLGVPVTLQVDGLPSPIETDIPTDKKTGTPRWIFRERKWVRDFVRLHNLRMEDTVTIRRLGERTYQVSPNNNIHVIEKEPSTKHQKPLADPHLAGKTQKKALRYQPQPHMQLPQNSY